MASHVVLSPAPIAGDPGWSAIVCVDLPLFASGANFGSPVTSGVPQAFAPFAFVSIKLLVLATIVVSAI